MELTTTKGKITFITRSLLIGFLITLFFTSWGTINAGERGVRLQFGAVINIVDEGFYFKIPFIQEVKKMDIKILKDEVEASGASKDLQNVSSKIAVNYHISPTKVDDIYKNVGLDYKTKLIDPALQESVKASTSQFTAEELITKREVVREEIKALLSDKMISYGIIIDQFNIIDFDFSESFNVAIEAKVTAEQNALAAKNKLEQIKYEAEQTVTSAKAEAEAIKIKSEAVNAQGGSDYVALKAIEKWNGTLPTYMLGETTPFIQIPKNTE